MTPRHKGFLSAYVRDPGALQKNSEDSGARALRGGKTDLEQRIEGGQEWQAFLAEFQRAVEDTTSEDSGSRGRLGGFPTTSVVRLWNNPKKRDPTEDPTEDTGKPHWLHNPKKRSTDPQFILRPRAREQGGNRSRKIPKIYDSDFEYTREELRSVMTDMFRKNQRRKLFNPTAAEAAAEKARNTRLNRTPWDQVQRRRAKLDATLPWNNPYTGRSLRLDRRDQEAIDERNLPVPGYDPLGVGVEGGAHL